MVVYLFFRLPLCEVCFIFRQMASLEDQYQKALRLYQEDSANDPESEPYKSKYAAREIFEELKSRLSKQLDEDDVDDAAEDQLVEEGVDGVGLTRARMAAVVYHLGVIAVETEELSTGEEHLKRALIILGDHEGIATGVSSMKVGDEGVLSAALSGDVDSLLSSSSSETVSVSPATISATSVALAISCHNQLGILWSHRNVFSTARRHLDRANVIYEEYQKQNASSPRTIHSLFSACTESDPDENSGTAALEKLHTLTFYYLAQVQYIFISCTSYSLNSLQVIGNSFNVIATFREMLWTTFSIFFVFYHITWLY